MLLFHSIALFVVFSLFFFFLNNPATPEFSPFPLPAPLPIFPARPRLPARPASRLNAPARSLRRPAQPTAGSTHPVERPHAIAHDHGVAALPVPRQDRKSTRLNSSHLVNSYAVFCLKKKKKTD